MLNIVKLLILFFFTYSYSLYSSESLIFKIANIIYYTTIGGCSGGAVGYSCGVSGTGLKLLYDNSRSTPTSPINEEGICNGNLGDCSNSDIFLGSTSILPTIGGAFYGAGLGMMYGIKKNFFKNNNTAYQSDEKLDGKYINKGSIPEPEPEVKIPIN